VIALEQLEGRIKVLEEKLGINQPKPNTCQYVLRTRCGCTREYIEKYPPAPTQEIAIQRKPQGGTFGSYSAYSERWDKRVFNFAGYDLKTNTAFYDERL
jgi:hypothetical protein